MCHFQYMVYTFSPNGIPMYWREGARMVQAYRGSWWTSTSILGSVVHVCFIIYACFLVVVVVMFFFLNGELLSCFVLFSTMWIFFWKTCLFPYRTDVLRHFLLVRSCSHSCSPSLRNSYAFQTLILNIVMHSKF